MDLQSAKEELNALLNQKTRVGRFFWAFIPGMISLVMLITAGTQINSGVFLLSVLLLCWSIGTALKIIPNPGPPRSLWPGYDRIKYLEGFLDAAKKTIQEK